MNSSLIFLLVLLGNVDALLRSPRTRFTRDVRGRLRMLRASSIFPDAGGIEDSPEASTLSSDRRWIQATTSALPKATQTHADISHASRTHLTCLCAASGATYWWREGLLHPDDPEISMTDPTAPLGDYEAAWKVGQLESGQRYLWRESSDDDDDEPEVWSWTEATLDSGAPYWFDEDGAISLQCPFEPGWEGPDED